MSRRRVKTFTGCWTCRRRKVKCDEGRPHCQVCLRKHLTCDGYDVRLNWLPPETPVSNNGTRNDLKEQESVHRDSYRSLILNETQTTSLSWEQVEEIIKTLDSTENAESTNIANFGFFSINASHRSPQIRDVGASLMNTPLAVNYEPLSANTTPGERFYIGLDCDLTSHGPGLSTEDGAEVPILDDSFWEAQVQNLLGDNAEQLACQVRDNIPYSYALASTNANVSPANHCSEEFTPAGLDHPEDQELLAPQSMGLWINVPDPVVLPHRERFLMHHYMTHVVNLFCVIDNTKSPWKLIHIPRVIQATGDLSLQGRTSSIRDALRNALLSISAFYLSNDRFSDEHGRQGIAWLGQAQQYKHRAICLLKQSVESSPVGSSRPRYKELLATILSMITINVMSGDTATCGVHLDGAERLINYVSMTKKSYSRRAKALHKIYLYLRIIYESTKIRSATDAPLRFSPLSGPFPRRQSPLTDDSFEGNDQVHPNSVTGFMGTSYSPEASSSYEHIYGVPHSLLMLLKETTSLIEQVEGARLEHGEVGLNKDLATRCEVLENDIFDWRSAGAAIPATPIMPVADQIIHHQSQAFHNALIIYFSQSIRLVDSRYLRSHVEAVLVAIEAIERIKAEMNILAGPLLWPAFIAASEASDADQQQRFRAWYDEVDKYGFAASRTGVSVLKKVWDGVNGTGDRATSSWRMVIRDTGHILMLS